MRRAAAAAALVGASRAAVVTLAPKQRQGSGVFDFERLELDPTAGKVIPTLVNGTMTCTCAKGEPVSAMRQTDAAQAVVDPSGSTLYWAEQCGCAVTTGPHSQHLTGGPPVVMAYDVASRRVRHLATLPKERYNFDGYSNTLHMVWEEPGTLILGQIGDGVNGSDVQSNRSTVYSMIDTASGAVTMGAGIFPQCPTCSDSDTWMFFQGAAPAGHHAVAGYWVHATGHLLHVPGRILSIDAGTGAVNSNISYGSFGGIYQWFEAREGDDTLWGWGECCNADMYDWCDMRCGSETGTFSILRWARNMSSPPELHATLLAAPIGINRVSAAGAARHSGDLMTFLGVKIGDGAWDSAPLRAGELRALSPVGGAAPPQEEEANCTAVPGNQTSCAAGGSGRDPGPQNKTGCAAQRCCWDEYNNWCWQQGKPAPGPGPQHMTARLVTVNLTSGKVLAQPKFSGSPLSMMWLRDA